MPATAAIPKVYFHFLESSIPLEKRNRLKQFLISQFNKHNTPLNKLDYIFCSDEFLLDLNIRMLAHNYLTDIITFPLHEAGEPVISEIYISLDRVKENAQTFGVTPKVELLRVIFHGALHLLGFSDTNPGLKQEMRRMEDQWIRDWAVFHVEHS